MPATTHIRTHLHNRALTRARTYTHSHAHITINKKQKTAGPNATRNIHNGTHSINNARAFCVLWYLISIKTLTVWFTITDTGLIYPVTLSKVVWYIWGTPSIVSLPFLCGIYFLSVCKSGTTRIYVFTKQTKTTNPS